MTAVHSYRVKRSVKILKRVIILLVIGTILIILLTIYSVREQKEIEAPRTAAERALLDAKEEVQRNPRNPQARIKLARVYIGIGKHEDAVKTLKSALNIDPDNIEALYLLGVAYYEAGELSNSLHYLKKAARVKDGFAPQYSLVYFQMGNVYFKAGKYEDAAKAYKKAIAFEPEAADYVYALGQAYEKMGNTEEAIKAYKGVLKFIPDDERAKKALQRLEPLRKE